MNPDNAKTDPWPKILDLLNRYCACGNATGHPVPTRRLVSAHTSRRGHIRRQYDTSSRDPHDLQGCVTINVLELTEWSAIIAWYDPTRCRYEDQRWNRIKARQAGVCAITGAVITAGADVFRPARTRGIAANADAMILAPALQYAVADMP